MGKPMVCLQKEKQPNARKLCVIHHIYLIRYLFCYSYVHNVAPKGKFIAFVTTEAETDQPEEDLKPGIDLLGSVNEKFYDMYDRFEPCNDHEVDGCFISTSYDPTTHFEITVKDVVGMYSKITGKVCIFSLNMQFTLHI
ncbi:guanosine nucleotide diphosphate dissociation inhibitor 2-like [Phaseolus vulgaris]|uniref:guanosine nucleotide diphosphate dissociation inhibitor 2-like n=1 Tax=Phaseolus vulgaris TaxID=3885 RepID=UPI0035CAA7BB